MCFDRGMRDPAIVYCVNCFHLPSLAHLLDRASACCLPYPAWLLQTQSFLKSLFVQKSDLRVCW